MDNEARLLRAFGAPVAPKRDASFTLSVMRAAERRRFQRESTLAILRMAGMAAAAGALVVPLMAWFPANWDGLQNGLLGAGAILALVSFARIMSQRIAVAAR